jgi:hypothetical protein
MTSLNIDESKLSTNDTAIPGNYRTRLVYPTRGIIEYQTPTIPLNDIPSWIGGPVEKISVMYLGKVRPCYMMRDNMMHMDRLEFNERLTDMWRESLAASGARISGLRIYGIGVIAFDWTPSGLEPWDLSSYKSKYPLGVEPTH